MMHSPDCAVIPPGHTSAVVRAAGHTVHLAGVPLQHCLLELLLLGLLAQTPRPATQGFRRVVGGLGHANSNLPMADLRQQQQSVHQFVIGSHST
jgi:hypothetical protein